MKRIVFFLSLLAAPVAAQQPVDTMLLRRIMALEAHVAQLQLMVGVKGFNSPQIPCADMEANRPSWSFPNGEYDLAYRNRQFGCASTRWDGYQAQITGLAERVGAIESQSSGGQPVGTAVFDVLKARRICIVDAGLPCDDDWNAQLQIRGNGLANIGLESNMAHIDPQDPSHTHSSQLSNSTDGGTRLQQNVRSTFSRGFVTYVNPCREWLNFGPDSRGSVSIYVGGVSPSADAINNVECVPLPHDGAQDFVFKVDEARRRSQIIITRPNWQLEWIYSSALHAVDIVVPQPPPQP